MRQHSAADTVTVRLPQLVASALCVLAALGASGSAATPGLPDAEVAAADRALVERGRYLTRIGNCAGCHTAPGGRPLAGGLRLETEFGVFHTPNITPDEETGIGGWSQEDFWNALHHGRRADGAALYPACPYPSFTLATRNDVDAIYAYLRAIPEVRQANRPHALDFPYGTRALLSVWQTLYFTPGQARAPLAPPDGQRSEAWRRGRYLVEGLGHCNACHRERGRLGALSDAADAPGALIHDWYAPSLSTPAEAGLQNRSTEQAAAFLRSGKSARAVMMGPMAEVVFDSLRYLSPADANAMGRYLTAVPEADVQPPGRLVGMSEVRQKAAMERGGALYARHCAECHGERGRGPDGVVALAANPTVTMADPTNLVNIIRLGGFPASTEGYPRPHGMPPFQQLDRRELADVVTYIRRSWGNEAAPVSPIDLR